MIKYNYTLEFEDGRERSISVRFCQDDDIESVLEKIFLFLQMQGYHRTCIVRNVREWADDNDLKYNTEGE